MHATDFGLTLIIANPAAQLGAAREVAERLQRFMDMTARASQFDLVLTERMGHAKELAAQAQGYRTVIALGGDGVIHEVVNGLMTQDEAVRPALAILPVGSGNDFAQTLGIDDFSGKDFGALLSCELQRQDIGRIRSWNPASGSGEASVEYYDQTLSIGIDAAIGLGTTELRKKTGLPMFLSAKDGHHTKLPPVRMRRCRHAALTLEEPDYPIQADGEPVVASRIEVDILAGALEVWHPTR